MTSRATARPYRKKKRAEREDETRQRITEAAVELHRTRGPAETAIADVAKLAGVSRMTVYNHFPTDVDLFTACSTHWASENPFPDYDSWAAIEDPSERVKRALQELYRWYRDKDDMLGKVFRDLPTLPALKQVMEGIWSAWVAELVRTLSKGWPIRGTDRKALCSSLALAVDFNTWRVLTESGMSPSRAADLQSRMIIATFGS